MTPGVGQISVSAVATRLAHLAVELDDLVLPLEERFLTDVDVAILGPAMLHLTGRVAHLEDLVTEVSRLDQRPRRRRFLKAKAASACPVCVDLDLWEPQPPTGEHNVSRSRYQHGHVLEIG